MFRVRLISCLFCIAFSFFLHGCVVIPIPDESPEVLYGEAIKEGEAKSPIRIGEGINDIKARFGEPTFELGQQKVFVYMWTVKAGKVIWLVGGAPMGVGGVESVAVSHLLFVAFDTEGKVILKGQSRFKPFDTVTEQVGEWLLSTNQSHTIHGPRLSQLTSHKPLLFVYRPSTSPCKFPTFDSNIFKPSVTVNGRLVGDLAKGEYLGIELNGEEQKIVIDPVPYYRSIGHKDGSFETNKVPIELEVNSKNSQAIIVEAYLCTGMGSVVMHAAVQDAQKALHKIRSYSPAW